MTSMHQAVIVSAARTPIGSFNGALSSIPSTQLGSLVIAEALRRAQVPSERVDEVFMGCVLQAGLGQAPARQALLGAGLPDTVEATTINKVCGSGLKSIMLAAQAVALGEARIIVAGGMESMSCAPHLLAEPRQRYRIGHRELTDSVIKDGLWDPYGDVYMGQYGETCAEKYGFTRAELDDFAMESYRRARHAVTTGAFRREIVPVSVPNRRGIHSVVTEDEEPNRVDLARLSVLKSAFKADGLLTAGNSSSCNDGAAALVLVSEAHASLSGLVPMARIVGYAGWASTPEWFTIAPVKAITRVLDKTGLSLADIDLFEINEAFSSASLAIQRELNLDPGKVNVNGGAVALGHPIGASGARIVTTLLYALEARGLRRGLASICIGGGEALAIVVERPFWNS